MQYDCKKQKKEYFKGLYAIYKIILFYCVVAYRTRIDRKLKYAYIRFSYGWLDAHFEIFISNDYFIAVFGIAFEDEKKKTV